MANLSNINNKFLVTTGGNVGINSTSPGEKLEVNGNIQSLDTIYIKNASNGVKWQFYRDGNETLNFRYNNGTDWNSNAISIKNNNNVGIGTTSPVRNVSVFGSSSAVMSFHNSTTGSTISDGMFIGNDANLAYVFNYEATPLIFATDATERMRIDSSGIVTITRSPFFPAESLDDVTTLKIENKSQSFGGTAAGIQLNAGDGDTIGAIFSRADGNDNSQEGLFITATTDNPIIFGTNTGTTNILTNERMRITSGGYLKASNGATYFSSTGSYHELNQTTGGEWSTIIHNNTAAPYGLYINYSSAAPNSGGAEFIYCADSSAVRFYVNSNGGIGNFSSNNVNISDERVKNNIENSGDYLNKICSIPVRLFNYKDEEEGTPKNLGVIAQEVEAVAPELVSNDGFGETPEDGIPLKSVYSTDMMYAMMKSIQELKAEIDDLKNKCNCK